MIWRTKKRGGSKVIEFILHIEILNTSNVEHVK